MKKRIVTLIGTVVLLVFVSTVVVSAAGEIPDTCEDSVEIDGHVVCFMGHEPDPARPGWTLWTYGVLKNENLQGNGLSHIVFDLCIDEPRLVVPTNGDTYTTPGGYGDFVGRAGINYQVVVSSSPDPTTQVGGIKFEGGTPQSVGDVDIFQFSQPTQSDPGAGPNWVGFKTGHVAEQVEIDGPKCDGSSAVELTSFRAQSLSLFSRILQWLGLR